jgi:hypothetical protein
VPLVEIDDDEREIPDALRPAVDALDDAHHSWHDAARAYHDASEFRRSFEQVVQSLRNVTFRLQSKKAELPEFETWYAEWVAIMKDDPFAAWIHDTRTDLVHRSGLERTSKARLKLIRSYLDEPELVGTVPATRDTSRLVEKFAKSIPRDHRQHAAVEVSRIWESPKYPGVDLLFIATRVFRLLDALLTWAGVVLVGEDADEESTPEQFLRSFPVPACMALPPSIRPLLIAADTLEPLEIGWRELLRDDNARIPPPKYKLPSVELSDDPAVRARQCHEVARRIFKKDGAHIPILFLRDRDGDWTQRVLFASDRREKYLQWYTLAKEARFTGIDAYIFTSEIWTAPASSVTDTTQYPPDLSTLPDARESLVTWFESADGDSLSLHSEIVRFLGRAYLKKAEEVDEVGVSGFSMPLQRVWKDRSATEQPDPGRDDPT